MKIFKIHINLSRKILYLLMKKFITTTLTIVSVLTAELLYNQPREITSEIEVDIEKLIAMRDPRVLWWDQWGDLVNALIYVESRGDSTAVGVNDDRGILQITPIAVKEASRISGKNYSHNDAYSVQKSLEMFYIIANRYCPEVNYEKMARIWNGGPRGYTKECTEEYWSKVEYALSGNHMFVDGIVLN